MAPINTFELCHILSSRLAVYAANHNPENERQRLIDYHRMIDKFMANPNVFAALDGQHAEAPDHARKVKKAKFGQSPIRMNNENTAPNPRMMPPSRIMSPIAEHSDNSDRSQQSEAVVNPPSAHKTEKIVQAMNVAKLRKELKKRGKETNGLKRDLQFRLVQAMRDKRREENAQQLVLVSMAQKEQAIEMNNVVHEAIQAKPSFAESIDTNTSNKLTENECQEMAKDVTMQPAQHQNEVSMQPTVDHEDVDMKDAAAVIAKADSNMADAMDRAVKLSVSSSLSEDAMEVELNESIAKVSLDKAFVPSTSCQDGKQNSNTANVKQLESLVESDDSFPGNYADAMDLEQSIIEAPNTLSFKPSMFPQVGSTSKVMELVELAESLAKARSESAPPQKKASFVVDQYLPTSPMPASKTEEEDEKCKQALLSLKKLKKTPSHRAPPDTESKPESVATSSAYKMSSLAALRSEQKASFKVNNPDTFLVNSIKVAPLGLTTASKMAADEARKARLAEMRGKSKPAALTKPMEAPSQLAKVFSSLKSKAASTMDFTDQKKKQLAAQMREKTAQKKGEPMPKPDIAPPPVEAVVAATCSQQNAKQEVVPQKSAATTFGKGTPLASVVQAFSSQKQNQAPVQRTEQQMVFSDTASSAKKKTTPHDHRRDDLNIFSPHSTYEISDREHSDTEEEESDDENIDAADKKQIPRWARKEHLEPALMKQYQDNRLDPDEIFHHGISTCDLEAIFDKQKSKFRKRTSSGNWTKDRVTPAEQLAYKRAMGFKQAK